MNVGSILLHDVDFLDPVCSCSCAPGVGVIVTIGLGSASYAQRLPHSERGLPVAQGPTI